MLNDILKLNTESYSYDPVGNRQTGPKSTDSYTYDSGNEQLSYKGKILLLDTNDQNEYDLNGNLTKKTETEGKIQTITNYAYDDENRLTGVEIKKLDGSGMRRTYAFAYDPFGRRISQALERDDFTINLLNPPTYPQITNYVYDEQNIIAEYDQNNKQIATYIHGPNIDEPLSAEIRNNRIYYHADGLGSITALTNHMGMTIQKYDYDAFGNIKFTPFPIWIKQPYMYTAREYDHETGLYYYRARYYDPKMGRFITRDPILHPAIGNADNCSGRNLSFQNVVPPFEEHKRKPQNLNPYVYTRNNPINYVDPQGLACGSGLTEILVPDSPYGYDFTQSCEIHDLCYGTCGVKKEQCDRLFLIHMLATCFNQSNYFKKYNCAYYAVIYYAAVSALGRPAYNDAQSKCLCKVK